MFPEEFPTDPPSLVLNGGIFALWGDYDIWIGLGDADARKRFEDGVETLARNVHRWDTGYWSRYDLYPHRIVNLASPWYHTLHICQIKCSVGSLLDRSFWTSSSASRHSVVADQQYPGLRP